MIKLFILHLLLKIANSEELVDSPPESNCENSIWFQGDCQDVFADSLCGEEALGERLYLGEDGLGYCDCDKGWVRYKERCYQEFTPAFCTGENEILKLNTKPKPRIIFGESAEILTAGLKHNFSCIENPCEPSNYPHTSTWNSTLETGPCHHAKTDLEDCEVALIDGVNLGCCTPTNRSSCTLSSLLSLFASAPVNFRSCGKGKIWSSVRDKC